MRRARRWTAISLSSLSLSLEVLGEEVGADIVPKTSLKIYEKPKANGKQMTDL